MKERTVSLGEGSTPVVELPRLAVEVGVKSLLAKLEGSNPTGSYKDRIAARSMEVALDVGASGWIATSSGNAATSFAAYGRRAGLPGILCVQHSIPREKLVPALALGAHVISVSDLGEDADPDTSRRLFEVVQEVATRHQLFVGITAHKFNEPGMRGVETISHEFLDDGWKADVAYVPVGGGGLVAAIARGFLDRGATTAVVAAQPSGCGPIARCLEGELPTPLIDRSESSISGLQLPGPPDGELAIKRILETEGWGVVASDSEILEAQRELCLFEGVFVEPAAACTLAGLRNDVRAGRVNDATSVLLVLTGSGLKDLATIERSLQRPRVASVEELPAVLADWSPDAFTAGRR